MYEGAIGTPVGRGEFREEAAEGGCLELSLEPDRGVGGKGGGERRGKERVGPAMLHYEALYSLQRVLRFKSQQRDPLKRARIQLPSVAYLLSCHKTRHCPSPPVIVSVTRNARSRSFDLTTVPSSSRYLPPMSLSLSLCYSFSFPLCSPPAVALCRCSRALTCYMTVFIFLM